jgi:hypothetical protein
MAPARRAVSEVEVIDPGFSPIRVLGGAATLPSLKRQGGHEAAEKMKNGLYSITTNGFDGVDWPPGGVVVLQNGVLLGGGSFTYFVGSYSLKDGILKGDCVFNPHTPPPPSHLYFNAKDIGVGLSGTYEDDQAELTATVLIGTRSLTLQITLRKLADI